MSAEDYTAYDRLRVAVKKDKREEVVSRYRMFAWEQTDSREDGQYDDIEHLAFRRRHALPHKDRLQLLQVHMESALNALGKLERNRHARSLIFGLVSGLLGVVLIAAGIALILWRQTVTVVVSGAAAMTAGAVLLTVFGTGIKKVRAKEEAIYRASAERQTRALQAYCREAQALTGCGDA